jgi:Uncharacterized protein conserved in bacteria (DUF2330)
MIVRNWRLLPLAGALFIPLQLPSTGPACCPAPPAGKPVLNADQTVIIIWDAAARTQHFIRQASFKSEADNFGFLVPSPSQPELNESGNEAFSYLQKLTEPETIRQPRPQGQGCGCGGAKSVEFAMKSADVRVLEEKMVAGFKASVLEAGSANALVNWLKDNGYAFSPQVEAWAKPYIDQGWKFTALKIAKSKDDKDNKLVASSALRMTFKTDRPLFPYREPESTAKDIGTSKRLLRIYFVAEARYQGDLTKDDPWTGKVAWTNKLKATDRSKALELLKLPETTGPAEWWLTEFEDDWPYRVAPADVFFARCHDQNEVKRPPNIEYVSTARPPDFVACILAAIALAPALVRRFHTGRSAAQPEK